MSTTSSSVVTEPLFDFDPKDEAIHKEFCSLICRWLADHKYSATLQIFRDEINAHGRDQHSIRKASRQLFKGVEDGNWENAHIAIKKLEAICTSEANNPSIVATVSVMVSKQQFLELVDEGDGQRAFSFFSRRMKPLEDMFSRAAFQQLTYLLTCRSVSDAASVFPEFKGWTSTSSRAALLKWLQHQADTMCSNSQLSHNHTIEYCEMTSIESLTREALSYQYLVATNTVVKTDAGATVVVPREAATATSSDDQPKFPSSGDIKNRLTSVLRPLHCQLPPINRVMTIRVKLPSEDGTKRHLVTAMHPFLDRHAVVLGTRMGDVMWCEQTSPNSDVVTSLLYAHQGRVTSAAESDNILATAGGKSVVLYDIASRKLVADIATHSESLTVAVTAAGRLAAAGCADGEIILAEDAHLDAVVDDEQSLTVVPSISASTPVALRTYVTSHLVFSSASCTSLCFNQTGATMYAGFKDGMVRIIDTVVHVVTRSLAPPLRAEVLSVSLSPSSLALLVSHRNNILRVWNVVTGAIERERYGGISTQSKMFVRSTFGASDEQILSASNDGRIYAWSRSGARSRAANSNARITAFIPPDDCAEVFAATGSRCVADIKMHGLRLVASNDEGEISICYPHPMQTVPEALLKSQTVVCDGSVDT